MKRWTNQLRRDYLAQLAASLLSLLSFFVQVSYNSSFPPNHNDFLGLGGQFQAVWAPFTYVEGALSTTVFTPLYFEYASFAAISISILAIFFAMRRVTNDVGGLVASTVFALSPFAVRASSVIPLPSLIGMMLTMVTVAAAYSRSKTTALLLAVSGFLLGFFPLYAMGLLSAVLITYVLAWLDYDPSANFRSGFTALSILPSFLVTLFVDGQRIFELHGESFSVLSQTLPQGFSLPTLLTWFGPLTIVFSLVALYRSVGGSANNSPVFAGLTLVGGVLFAQRLVDPLLGFSLLGLGLFALCGIGAHDVLNIRVKEHYQIVLYGAVILLLFVALINLVAFLQVDVSASRPDPVDVSGYKRLASTDKPRLIVSPRETAIAKYFAGPDRIPRSWTLQERAGDAIYDQVFITDLVEDIPQNATLVLSDWRRSVARTTPRELLSSSQCFSSTFRYEGFSAWENQCVIRSSTAVAPTSTTSAE